jgi:hypothetical protein
VVQAVVLSKAVAVVQAVAVSMAVVVSAVIVMKVEVEVNVRYVGALSLADLLGSWGYGVCEIAGTGAYQNGHYSHDGYQCSPQRNRGD